MTAVQFVTRMCVSGVSDLEDELLMTVFTWNYLTSGFKLMDCKYKKSVLVVGRKYTVIRESD